MPTKVIAVFSIVFLILLLACLLAPRFGADTSDSRREGAHPDSGWYPPLMPH
jgi:hypothetical protein